MAFLAHLFTAASRRSNGNQTGKEEGRKKKKKRTAMRSGCTLVLYPWAWSLPPSVTRSIDLEMGLDMEVQILASEVCRGQKEGKGKGKGRREGMTKLTYVQHARTHDSCTHIQGSGHVGCIAPARQRLDR